MRLVIQGRAIRTPHLQHIHQLCNVSASFMQIGEHAYYLQVSLTDIAEIKKFCTEQSIDCALVDDKQRLSHFGLCVMDMDSTLINIECIDEIADLAGLKPQVAAITESAMRGEIDFAESLKKRVALLAGLEESALHQVVSERLKLNPGAQEWVSTCKQFGIKTMLVSGGFTFFADKVKAMLGLDYAVSNTLETIDGKLTGKILGDIVDAQAKADHLVKLRDELGLKASQTIAIGDGANDLKMMAVAGVGVAYHAKPIVQQNASYALNFVGLEGVIGMFTV